MTLQVAVVVGNPKPMSRTRKVAELLVERLLTPDTYDLHVVDLADHLGDVFTWPSETMSGLNDAVASSDLTVFASPTYKATYTGLLKSFLDRYPANGLAGVTAIPVHTGADFVHAMGPTFTLSPLLCELGATVPGRGVYLSLTQMQEVESVVDAAVTELASNIGQVARLGEFTRSGEVSDV
ncbi:NAD(P)H-dependent oxidoreductase [Rhodococcus sp. USK13]|uniref:NADPH-dependent FMN reductase n=1 Tax=Rhodococcus sp. USK13 TaxID=2806442 RepID=UPI001BCF00AC|nr:NAD(P)H-dependent oxidoreductase [Rhodococcus sp. USK13]